MKQAWNEAISQLQSATDAKKCWPCGCFHNTLAAISQNVPVSKQPIEFQNLLSIANQKLKTITYDCLGCQVCYPALAINVLNQGDTNLGVELEACPTEAVTEREGWPMLPGSYITMRYQAPVAICTLTNEQLTAELTQANREEIAIVGTLQTENLGIERLILNILDNPNIRFLIICGEDSRQAVGHLPGQSLIALSQSGVDNAMRIIEAKGKRPILRNLTPDMIKHFRQSVEVINLIGTTQIDQILQVSRDCAVRNLGASTPFNHQRIVPRVVGYLPKRMTSDPAGYVVIYVDRTKKQLLLEHYNNDGVLNLIVEGNNAAEIYIPAVEKGLISRLDHAAYLGRELACAEQALKTNTPYVQDGAPERSNVLSTMNNSCGCSSSCEDKT
jgi:tetrahydromethanopterin S-methyltransferase subunit A